MALNAAVPVAVPADQKARVTDPDHIGPCPRTHSPVIWQGIAEGRPTWKHADGSFTQRAHQGVTTEAGVVLQVPVILSVRPGR